MRFLVLLTATFSAVLAIGCAREVATNPPSTAPQDLQALGSVYKYLDYEKKPPPGKLADLNAYTDSLMEAWPKLQAGDYVVKWNVPFTEAAPKANDLLAYEKRVPAEGGWALLRNATVKEITPAEFKAAK